MSGLTFNFPLDWLFQVALCDLVCPECILETCCDCEHTQCLASSQIRLKLLCSGALCVVFFGYSKNGKQRDYAWVKQGMIFPFLEFIGRSMEKEKKPALPENIVVACNGMKGIYVPKHHMIMCKCCLCGSRMHTLTEWERHAGSKARKWRYSVKVESTMRPLKEWIDEHNSGVGTSLQLHQQQIVSFLQVECMHVGRSSVDDTKEESFRDCHQWMPVGRKSGTSDERRNGQSAKSKLLVHWDTG